MIYTWTTNLYRKAIGGTHYGISSIKQDEHNGGSTVKIYDALSHLIQKIAILSNSQIYYLVVARPKQLQKLKIDLDINTFLIVINVLNVMVRNLGS